MERISIKTVEKQLQEEKFHPRKGFKIKDNNTVILYALTPFLSDEITQFASAQVVNHCRNKLLITVISCFSFSSLEYDAKELFKKAFVLFRDPEKGGKLIARSVPFGIVDISEAMGWI